MKANNQLIIIFLLFIQLLFYDCKNSERQELMDQIPTTDSISSEAATETDSPYNSDTVPSKREHDFDSITQDECFDKSTLGLPYNQKNTPLESGYKVVKCEIEVPVEFLCDGNMLRYIPLPDYKAVKIVLTPMDCGDFNYRFFLLTFVNKKMVAQQYVEGEFFEPDGDQYTELTYFTIDKRYKITVTTDSVEKGKTTLKEKVEFQLMPDGTLKRYNA